MENKTLIDKAQSSLISLYTQLGRYDLAITALHSLNSPKTYQKISRYSICARLYYGMGKLDSATYYYKNYRIMMMLMPSKALIGDWQK